MIIYILITIIILAILFYLIGSHCHLKSLPNCLHVVLWLLSLALILLRLNILFDFIHCIFLLTGNISKVEQLAQKLTNHFSDNNIFFSLNKQTLAMVIVQLINHIGNFGLLICLRRFIKNISKEAIFVIQNVYLLRWSSLFMLIGSFVMVSVQGTYSLFNLKYLLAAFILFTISNIFKKAIAIALENEFTI